MVQVAEGLQLGTELVAKSDAFLKDVASILAEKANEGGKLSVAKMDENQLVHYDLAWGASLILTAQEMLGYPEKVGAGAGSLEEKLSLIFIAEALQDFFNRFKTHISYLDISFDDYIEKVVGCTG